MRLPDPAPGPVKCPRCHSADVAPIQYGFPGPNMAEAATRGEIVLGGCVIGDHDPIWFCRACQARWDEEGTVCEEED